MAERSQAWDIADLAREAGVSSRTIRYYGELGLLRCEHRGPGGRRRFGADAAERLRFIDRLKKLGLTLDEIGRLNRAFEKGSTAVMLAELDGLLCSHLETVLERIAELGKLEQELRSYLSHIHRKKTRKSA